MRLKTLGTRWRQAREPLASLFDRHPGALSGSRHPRGLEIVPIEMIVGTARSPSQNTTDFLPLPQLRGTNWESRWQRIQQATSNLAILPPGTTSASHPGSAPTSLLGSEELRQAGEGRFSPRTEMLRGGPSRVEIARSAEEAEAAGAAFEASEREVEVSAAEARDGE